MSVELKIAKIMANNDAFTCKLEDLRLILKDRFNFNKNFKIITIAGTNGKGTTVSMLERLLIKNNKNFLSHTSPHIFKFNERISLNKEPICDIFLLEFLDILEDITFDYRLSYYQIAFLCACMYSQKVEIDYLILEVGIGGRLDPANILDPDITAITNIDFDHCELLGETLDKIGLEKVAISRKYVPLFLGSKMPNSVYKYAKSVDAIIYNHKYNYSYKDCFTCSYNIVMGISEYLLNKRKIKYIPKLDNVRADLRFKLLKNDYTNSSYIFVDVAHNPSSILHLFNLLTPKFNSNKIKYEAIFGILASKDISKILSISKNFIYEWKVVDLNYLDSRALDIEKVQHEFNQQNILKVNYIKNLSNFSFSKRDTVMVVFGSFVLAGEFIKEYEKYKNKK